jgi:DNA-binding LytR/AlgR family response regulator
MRVLIADDEPIAREVLRGELESCPGVEVVGEAASGEAALEQVLELRPDVVLLDHEMPGRNGIEVAASLGPHAPLIVFVTAYQDHALQAFEVGAVDYLLKPVRRERLEAALAKVRQRLSVPAPPPPAGAPRKIVGRRGPDMYLLDPEDIIAFEAEGELVHIITAQQKFLCDHTLKALEEKLPPGQFRRVHRKTIINTDHIRRISPLSSKRWLLRMSNGYEAVVSKRLGTAIREQTRW